MMGSRSLPNETSLLLLAASDTVASSVTDVRCTSVALASISIPVFEIVPRLMSWSPVNPVDGGAGIGISAFRVVLLYVLTSNSTRPPSSAASNPASISEPRSGRRSGLPADPYWSADVVPVL